jgi:hypothetical protein
VAARGEVRVAGAARVLLPPRILEKVKPAVRATFENKQQCRVGVAAFQASPEFSQLGPLGLGKPFAIAKVEKGAQPTGVSYKASFYIQDPTPDAQPETSDGLQVFGASAAAGVSVGDEVSVHGMVSEFRSSPTSLTLTELTSPVVRCSRAAIRCRHRL